MNAMRYASDVTLITIPKLDDLSLPFAFKNVKALEMENASLLENNGELMTRPERTDHTGRWNERDAKRE